MALLSKMPPSAVSSTGTWGATRGQRAHAAPSLQRRRRALPSGLSLRKAGVLLVTPISNGGQVIFTPLYSAAISALAAFLLPLYVCNFCGIWGPARRERPISGSRNKREYSARTTARCRYAPAPWWKDGDGKGRLTRGTLVLRRRRRQPYGTQCHQRTPRPRGHSARARPRPWSFASRATRRDWRANPHARACAAPRCRRDGWCVLRTTRPRKRCSPPPDAPAVAARRRLLLTRATLALLARLRRPRLLPPGRDLLALGDSGLAALFAANTSGPCSKPDAPVRVRPVALLRKRGRHRAALCATQ